MRRVNLALDSQSTIPAGAHVEVVGAVADDATRPRYIPITLLQTSADSEASEAGGGSDVIATAGGATTGLIAATASFVEITSSVATKAVSLPAALAGKVIRLICQANGCELISAVAGDKVNDVVVGATNEAALVAGTLYTCVYDGVDNWIMTGLTDNGVVETPVTPDAL